MFSAGNRDFAGRREQSFDIPRENHKTARKPLKFMEDYRNSDADTVSDTVG